MRTYRPSRADASRAMEELEWLFGKKPPANKIAPLAGKGEVDKTSGLPEYIIPVPHKAQGGKQ
jgi:hypothetical protein